ncbi:hypothetical protein BN1095_3740002 [Clostridioides difficile]|uniref:Uncharacterized protein n=1 Tax=Clostridioides difficile TaxID=1496 RepID=A0A069APE0_CLODI|nr:hypothetical protein BN1095_3740002 [Clostridioides difficile]
MFRRPFIVSILDFKDGCLYNPQLLSASEMSSESLFTTCRTV